MYIGHIAHNIHQVFTATTSDNTVTMVKNPRKRQKTGKIQHKPVPLGADLRNDARKDDEERRLENLLFGVPYAPEKAGNEITVISDEEAENGQHEIGREFENLLDSDVCAELLEITLHCSRHQ